MGSNSQLISQGFDSEEEEEAEEIRAALFFSFTGIIYKL